MSDLTSIDKDVLSLVIPRISLGDALKAYREYISKPVYTPPKVQYRFPRSKKRRIQKKWRENSKNWRWPVYVLSPNPQRLLANARRRKDKASGILTLIPVTNYLGEQYTIPSHCEEMFSKHRCPHEYKGKSTWTDGADSCCVLCGARD